MSSAASSGAVKHLVDLPNEDEDDDKAKDDDDGGTQRKDDPQRDRVTVDVRRAGRHAGWKSVRLRRIQH